MARLVLTAHLAASQIEDNPDAAARYVLLTRQLANELGTPAAEAYALTVCGLSDHSPDTVGLRVAAARRILAAVYQGDVPELAPVGHVLLLTALLEQGEIRTLDIELSEHGEAISRFPELHDSRHAQWFRCLRAILDGRTLEAERLADTILASAAPEHEAASRSVWAAQIGTIRWMQGRLHEMEPVFFAARQEHPHEQLWAYSLAWLWHLQGRDDAARSLFGSFSDLDSIPRDRNLLVTLTILGELAARIGSIEQVELLRNALLPYSTKAVPVGLGLAFWGTVARTLGMLALRLSRHDEARAHFRTAIGLCSRNGAQAWLAESQLELADLEVAVGGDLVQAADLARQAEATASALGFPALLARARATLETLHRSPASDPTTAHPAPQTQCRAEIRVMGVFHVTSHTGTTAHWTSRKARELLKMLVARRGIATAREVFMHELWPDIHPDDLANRFSVALSTIRRALDPDRVLPVQHFVVHDGQSLHLNIRELRVDVEEFFDLSRRGDLESLRQATRLYSGDAFVDEPYADWAAGLRHEAQTTFCALARTLAAHDAEAGDFLAASELYRRVLEVEPFDEEAHDGLISALVALGAPGQARSMELRRQLLLDELAG